MGELDLVLPKGNLYYCSATLKEKFNVRNGHRSIFKRGNLYLAVEKDKSQQEGTIVFHSELSSTHLWRLSSLPGTISPCVYVEIRDEGQLTEIWTMKQYPNKRPDMPFEAAYVHLNTGVLVNYEEAKAGVEAEVHGTILTWEEFFRKAKLVIYREDKSFFNRLPEKSRVIVPEPEAKVEFLRPGPPNPQEHYTNDHGSLYKIAMQRGWDAYQFDAIKRIDRVYKKGKFSEDLQKTKDLIDLWEFEAQETEGFNDKFNNK